MTFNKTGKGTTSFGLQSSPIPEQAETEVETPRQLDRPVAHSPEEKEDKRSPVEIEDVPIDM